MVEEKIAKILKVNSCDVIDSWKIGCAPNWDSFAQMEIILMLDECYGLMVDDSTIVKATSVAGIKSMLLGVSEKD